MPAQTSKTPGDGSGTLSYTLASDSFDIESVYATIDATTATGPVTAELTVRDQSGVVIARKKQAATIPAGQAGSATWALRLDDEGAESAYTTVEDEGVALPKETILNFVGAGVTATDDPANARTTVTIPGGGGGGGGIQFDTYPQDGDWLYVKATGFNPDEGYGIELLAAAPSGSLAASIELLTKQTDGAGFVNEIAMGQYDTYSIGIGVFADAGLFLWNTSGGRYLLRQSSASDSMEFESHLQGFTFTSNNAGLAAFLHGDVFVIGANYTFQLRTGGTLKVKDAAGNQIFRIDANGALHGLTGKALTFDL